ncbi:hypothetical protein B5M09_008431 [Aphanomyces astaci]|uniref:DDE-1 domain-containing protein n=1 Tax=Aphanomyces astaci TaxID=112090 RepID=A0A425C5D3_APHAT|nr:hypothetical protein B5M09_008431 [Aphanomyces astaci]
MSKRSQGDLEDTHDIFAAEFHREYRAHGAESVYNVDETASFRPFLLAIPMQSKKKAWMDGRVWKSYLRTVLHDHMEEASVILVDNFDSHVSEASYKIINEELGSHLCRLPPNSTSMCQPLTSA